MSTRGKITAQQFVRFGVVVGIGLACALGVSGRAQAILLLKDSFGLSGINGTGASRFDAAGNFVSVVLHTDLSGLRAEFPFTSNEVWTAPGGHGVPTWGFSVSSPDPYETYGFPSFNGFGGSPEPTPADNGTMSLVVFPGDQNPPGKTDELLDFSPPAGAFQASLDVVGGGTTTAIGFTSTTATLYDNFETFGQVWMVLHGGAGQGGVGTWELHTNGLAGPSVSGTTLLGGFNPLAISYDPATHTVRGSINGVPTATISYTAAGISAVGFEGQWTVNNFIVQTGAILPFPMGDYNQNGVVDAADYTVWRDTLGQVGAGLAADGNGSGSIDAGDYDIWQANFAHTVGGGAMSGARGARARELCLVGCWHAGSAGGLPSKTKDRPDRGDLESRPLSRKSLSSPMPSGTHLLRCGNHPAYAGKAIETDLAGNLLSVGSTVHDSILVEPRRLCGTYHRHVDRRLECRIGSGNQFEHCRRARFRPRQCVRLALHAECGRRCCGVGILRRHQPAQQ